MIDSRRSLHPQNQFFVTVYLCILLVGNFLNIKGIHYSDDKNYRYFGIVTNSQCLNPSIPTRSIRVLEIKVPMLELFGQRTGDKVHFEESFGKCSIAMNIL